MSRRNIILLVVALLIAGVTAFIMSAQMGAGEEEAVVEQARNKDLFVLVAKADIPMGGFVRTFDQLEFREYKLEDIKADESNAPSAAALTALASPFTRQP